MKNNKIRLLVVLMLLCSMPALAMPNERSSTKPVTIETNSAALIERLEEIKSMDKALIARAEKKVLRKEVKSINKELKKQSDGVYLSVGAIVLIVLFLIIVL